MTEDRLARLARAVRLALAAEADESADETGRRAALEGISAAFAMLADHFEYLAEHGVMAARPERRTPPH